MHNIDLDLRSLSPWRSPHSAGIDITRTALIIVDMQVAFLEEGYPGAIGHARDIVPNINRLSRAIRRAGGRVIFTRHTVVDDSPRTPPAWQHDDPFFGVILPTLRPDATGHPIHPNLEVDPTDDIINKHRYSAFLPISSSIDDDLKASGIDTVIITGTVTNICCESSARDAHMLNYEVIFVADATAAFDDRAHNASLDTLGHFFAQVITTDDLIQKLNGEISVP